MAFATPIPPPGFVDLDSAYNGPLQSPVNTIGVVVDFLPATKSGGTDMTIKFTLHDHSWTQGTGLPVRFFQKAESQLPAIHNQGDVVILRNVKLFDYHGQRNVLSNSTSGWVTIEHSTLQGSSDPNGSDLIVHQSGTGNYRAAFPSPIEIQYAKGLLGLEDPSRWQQPAKPTSLQVANIMVANGGTPASTPEKFCRIEDLRVPEHKNDKAYVDLFAEVRRIYLPDGGAPRLELSVSDYSEHPFLYNYKPDTDEDATIPFDGDRFGYIENTHKLWPGPWGKMTMLVVLWPPHCEFAIGNVELGSFVFLKNVHIKLDKDGGKLEGHCHTDPHYESRVAVSVFKARDADGDDRLRSLLLRKRDYEEYCRKHQLRFIRDAKMKDPTMKREDLPGLDDSNTSNGNLNAKAKRNRENKKRRRAKANADYTANTIAADDPNPNTTSESLEPKAISLNTHVRCENKPIPLSTITSILDPSTLIRKTPNGNSFSLPFQNCCYKSKVRVVDFFPDSLEDFAAPARESQYAAIDEGDSESDVDMIQDDVLPVTNLSTVNGGEGGVRWQWRFFLLVEDARRPPRSGEDMPTQMELLVADSDADYLLRDIEACDLRKNPKALARLREKLFVLWGDLQERKEEMRDQKKLGNRDGAVGGRVDLEASARPFECFIKEYGIPSNEREGDWERMWRLCYTCI